MAFLLVFTCWGMNQAFASDETPDHEGPEKTTVEAAYDELFSARYRDAHTAAERLAEMGELGFSALLRGTAEKKDLVRNVCLQTLQDRFPTDSRTIDASIRGLRDTDNEWVSIRCAVHLGNNQVSFAAPHLKQILDDPELRNHEIAQLLRFAASEALAKLGENDVFAMLYEGLGSDEAYVRKFSNGGMKALCGRDLTDFGYETPDEDVKFAYSAYASWAGPIERAEWKAKRHQAILAFTKWLERDCPDLFARLDGASP